MSVKHSILCFSASFMYQVENAFCPAGQFRGIEKPLKYSNSTTLKIVMTQYDTAQTVFPSVL